MDGVFLVGLLSFDTASANPAPPATTSGAGFLELARGITPADGVAGRSISTGLLLPPLRMPPEGVNPPAHTPAADFASSGMRPARPADSPTKHGKLESGAPPSVAPVDGCPPGLSSAGTALEQSDAAAVVRFAGGMPVHPATGSPSKAAGSDTPGQARLPETNPETVPTAGPEAGGALAGTGSFPGAAFALSVGRGDRPEAGPPPLRPRGSPSAGNCSRLGVDVTLGRPDTSKTITLARPAAVSGPGPGPAAPGAGRVDGRRRDHRRRTAETPGGLSRDRGSGTRKTTGALSPALEQRRNQERIPSDTPGFTREGPDIRLDLAPLSAADANMGTHPIQPATMTAANPTSAIDRVEVLRLSRLPFSRLSQTGTVGSIPNQAKRAGKPFSFLASEQRIPEEREPAGCERMVDLASGRQATAALAPPKGFLATGT